MWSPDIRVRYVSFPLAVRGVSLPDDDGGFDVYVNALLPQEQQREVVEHEREHIFRDHFYDELRPVSSLEAEANRHPGVRKHPARPPQPVPPQKKELLPDVFFDRPDGMIPLFHSLDAMQHYLLAFLEQRRNH